MSSDRPRARFAVLAFVLLPLVAACGKKGDPIPPPRAIPQAVSDLTLRQRGDRILLEFTHPKSTSAGLTLPGIASATLYELLRPAPAAGQTLVVQPAELAGAKSMVVLTGPTLAAAIAGDRVRIELPLPSPLPEAATARAYAVRTVGPAGEASAWSNAAVLVPRAAPAAPEALEATAAKEGVRLTWTATPDASAGYGVLRRPADRADWGAPIALVDAGATSYLDMTARYGERYVYTVLALASRVPAIESAPRAEREIDFQDRFAPAAPEGLRAVALPAAVRLLWQASPDSDVAGYRVERALGDGEFESISPEAMAGVEHTDESAPAGRMLRYRVLAVDRAGNVSEPGVSVEVSRP